jgi:hypothetical protein
MLQATVSCKSVARVLFPLGPWPFTRPSDHSFPVCLLQEMLNIVGRNMKTSQGADTPQDHYSQLKVQVFTDKSSRQVFKTSLRKSSTSLQDESTRHFSLAVTQRAKCHRHWQWSASFFRLPVEPPARAGVAASPNLVPQTWYPKLGTPHLVPQAWYLKPGTPNLAPQTWYPKLGTPNLAPQAWYPKLGTPNLVPQTWYPKLGTPNLVPQAW